MEPELAASLARSREDADPEEGTGAERGPGVDAASRAEQSSRVRADPLLPLTEEGLRRDELEVLNVELRRAGLEPICAGSS